MAIFHSINTRFTIRFGMNIILGITGSISAYKTPWLVRDLRRAGHDVLVVMTPSAARFVSPLALQAVSLHDVVVDPFDPSIQESGSWHVHLAQWADLMLVAPCSANTLARLAAGLVDSSVNLVAASLKPGTPLLVAPAMDSDMWTLASTQRNVASVISDGCIVIAPESGELASGLIGEGRLPEISALVAIVQSHASASEEFDEGAPQEARLGAEHDATQRSGASLEGKHVLITAGPTHEAIDDVRFVANASSGRMGYALAEAARDRGALVTLVSGPTSIATPFGIQVIHVVSAQEMYNAVMRHGETDVFIMAAAVADYTPVEPVNGKMKKEETPADGTLTLTLKKTKDILAEVGSNKRAGQIVVGFALESKDLITQAQDKLIRKNADIIVANQAGAPRSGFGTTDNTITLVTRTAVPQAYPPMNKRACAEIILDAITDLQAGKGDA